MRKTTIALVIVGQLLASHLLVSQNPPAWVQTSTNGFLFSNPPTWPVSTGSSRFVYDPVLQQTLYVARQTGCTRYTNSLWAYNLPTNTFRMMTWSGSFPDPTECAGYKDTEDTPTYPGDRWDFAVAYDSLRSRFLVYSSDCGDKDMYHWYSSTPPYPGTPAGMGWAADCYACAPGIRVEASLTYTNPATDLIIMYGGLQSGTPTADTWQYFGSTNTWTRVNTACDAVNGAQCTSCGPNCSSLGQRAGHTLVYDSVNNKVVLFGGYRYPKIPLNDTWEYDVQTRTWTNWNPVVKPPAVKYPAMAFDPSRGVIWLHDALAGQNCSSGCDWTYSVVTHTWTQQSITGGPVPTTSQITLLMDYDPHCDALVATANVSRMVTPMWYLPLSGTLTCSH